ncbi:major capsid protein [Bradyrhizobium cenepequi]
MLSMNVFTQDAFSAISLTAAIDKLDYVPGTLSRMGGLLTPVPVRTDVIWIEQRSTGFAILPFSPRGTAPHQTGGDVRDARPFRTLRYSDASRITASELFGIRDFGSETALKSLQGEVARRQFKMKQNFSLTKEYHVLNLVTQAKVLDADGTTKVDWSTEFGQSIPAEVDFDLDNASPASGALRKKCSAVRRSMQVALKGVGVARSVVALCGDNFYDDLTAHPEVRETYKNWSAAADLRDSVGREWDSFPFGGITFINYRGTDDGTTVTIGTDKAKFFPLGAGIFQWAMSPGEKFEHLGVMGQEFYSWMVTDRDRDMWADVEMYSYPLPVCLMPSALYQARRT